MNDLVIMLVPLVVGTLTFAAVQGLKRVSALVETQSPAAKRILALVIAFSITWLAERLGTPSPCTVAAAEGCLRARPARSSSFSTSWPCRSMPARPPKTAKLVTPYASR